ncbi:MAG: hypothetical protein U0271_16140 [Polyangiaceae bacterium]
MRSRLLAGLAIQTAVLFTTPSFAQPDKPGEDAFVLYQEGNAAFKAGDTQLAYQKLRRSFELKPSADTAANLARTEDVLGKHRDAAEHLAYALRTFPSTGDANIRDLIVKELTRIEGLVGKITITCPPGTMLTVNGALIGLSSKDAIYVDPGTVTIRGKHETEGEAEVSVTVESGKPQTIELKLQTKTQPVSKSVEGPEIWPAVLLGVFGGASLAAGIGLTVGGVLQHGSAVDDAQACVPFTQACATTANDSLDQANLLLGIGIGGLAVGAVALAGMGIYLALSSSGTPTAGPQAAWRIQVLPGGLSARVSF